MSKQTIDVSQLSGWSNLSEGTQAVTVKTIVNGVENSASSNVVTVEKTLTKQTKEVSLLMVEGDQTILPDANMTMEKAIVKKPSTLIPSNIKQGVSIGGVVGELTTTGKEEVEVSEELNMANGNLVISPPDNTKTLSQVTIIKPDTFIAENIKKDVNIGGITGTYEPTSSGAELNIHYGDTAPEDTSKLWIKSEEPSNISFPVVWKPEQIVDGITDTGTTLPRGEYGMGTSAVGTKIYLFGGFGNGRLNTIQVFDTTNNTIQTLSTTLPQAAYAMGTAAVGTKIYLFGGYGSDYLNTIQVFDTTNNTIQTLSTTLPTAANGIGTVAVGTKIYLFGGNSSNGRLNTTQVFDTTNNTIQTLSTTLPTAANGIGTAAVGTKIYLFGGYGNGRLKTIRVFDTTNNTIQTLSTTLPTVASDMGTSAVGTKIYLFGGFGNGRLNTIQVFDTTNNTIQTLSTTLPQAAYAMGTAAVGTKIYLFGGYGSDYLNTIDSFTVDVPLSSNDIIVTQEYYSRTFKVLKAPTEVEVACKYVYKGDQNLAKFIDAYLYDGANWVNVNTGATVAISRTITATLTNVTAASGNATTIATGETKTLTYTAADGYVLPDTVTVSGATGIWNKDEGTLVLSNPTANVTFTIAGVEAASGHAVTITAAVGSYGVKIYDGTSSSGPLLGTITDQDNTPKTVTCSSGNLYLISDNGAYTNANTVVTGGVTIVSEGSWYYDGTFKVTADGTITISLACLIEGTQITLADGTTKAIEDITYDDELLVWNFYEGKFDKAKPTWIKVAEVAPKYNLVKFSNGAEVGFVGAGGENGYHRIFNKEAGAFTHTGCKDTPNGTTTFAQDRTFPTVVSQEVVEKEVKFYNVITDKHYNLFANGILTSCKLSNEYNIKDMKYVGEKLISGKEKDAYFEKIKKSITFKSTRK